MDSQFQSLKEEMHEMRKNYNNHEGDNASKNDDTLMCEHHEANHILSGSVEKKASEPIGVTLVLVTKSVGSLNDATVYADVSTEASNTNGLIINIVNSETTSLNQNGGDQANLWKIKVNVPNGVHYDVWFPLASVHDVTDQMKNSLYSNSFEALNNENMIIEEVATGSKATPSGTQEEGQSFTPVVDKIMMCRCECTRSDKSFGRSRVSITKSEK
ncbi:hypothetical protein Tco_0989778 [Tanacetum coccineum]|uniref:Uncharacterized protein n=1 Tax=Tanacetum coccineum TaxID=301880 RepID=A0ABQ5EUS1_9ASTR